MSLTRRIIDFNWMGYFQLVAYTQGAIIMGVGCAYYVMEHNQDTRYWMRNHHPRILRTFYTLAEDVEKNFEVRQLDTETWEKLDKIEKERKKAIESSKTELGLQVSAPKTSPPVSQPATK